MRPLAPAALLLALSLLALSACEDRQGNEEDETVEEQVRGPALQATDPEPELATPDPHWVESRVLDAEEQLVTDAGELLWASIEAHGGLSGFFLSGPLSFTAAHTSEERGYFVDTWSARVVAWPTDDEDARTVTSDGDAFDTLALVALPFLLSGPGITLESLGDVEVAGETHHPLRATASDSLDLFDTLEIYLHGESHLLGAVRYPETEERRSRFLTYDTYEEVGSISLATRIRTFADIESTDPESIVELSGLTFRPDLEVEEFHP